VTDVLSSAGVQVMVEVAQIASTAGSMGDRAEALVEQLRRVIPFDGAWIGLLDPERRAHLSLVQSGYDDRTRAYLDGPRVLSDIEQTGMGRREAALLRDLPFPVGESFSWAEYLWPAGFRDHVVVNLFRPDGPYSGILALHGDAAGRLTETHAELLGVLAPIVAGAVDPMRRLSVVASLIGDATAGVVLTRAGEPLPLPGLATHKLLAARSLLLLVAASQSAGQAMSTFLYPYRDPKAPDRLVRVGVLGVPSDFPDYLVAIVLISPAVDVHGLTPRELEILGLLVEGWPNGRIAAGLVVAERTVATHLEHILVKLRVPTRTGAAAVALRLGLYIPRRITLAGSRP
jgi:DNA-binding CsgD family transcriptional regulator